MDASIFKITKNKISLVPEALALTEHIQKLDSQQLKYVIMAYDYVYSPLRRKPLKQRKLIAVRKCWPENRKDFDPEKRSNSKTLLAAIEEYTDLLFDPLRLRLQSVDDKLLELNESLITTTGSKAIKDATVAIEFLEGKRDDLINEIEKDDELNANVSLTKGRSLSFMEKQKRSRELKKRLKQEDDVSL